MMPTMLSDTSSIVILEATYEVPFVSKLCKSETWVFINVLFINVLFINVLFINAHGYL